MKIPHALLAIAISALLLDHAAAWPTMKYTDAQIVERAELIVVAHIKDGSLARVIHIADGARSYEHRATLVITGVIKGGIQTREMPIIIHYGLLPVPARFDNMLDRFVEMSRIPPYDAQEAIKIYEDNPSEGFFRPSDDVRKDQIWLLRVHRTAGMRDDADVATTDLPGVWDPEDIQKSGKEQDLRKYLNAK
jgi:hypothetical protein